MNLEQLSSQIAEKLPAWLHAQRWFSSAEVAPNSARFIDTEVISEGPPALVWTLVETDSGDIYQVPIGLRVEGQEGGTLLGHEHALIGRLNCEGTDYVAYDALVDPVLDLALYEHIAPDADPVKSARPIGLEQSNTSLVFDNRVILKVFRRLYEGANPDLEVTKRLTDVGFKHVAPVLVTWEKGELDLAVGAPYLYDGTDGWKLALASVRDYFGADTQGATSIAGAPSLRIDTEDPALAGGDFADEAYRLGEVTASLHLALASQFPTESFDPHRLADSLESSEEDLSDGQHQALVNMVARLRSIEPGAAGTSMRVHGDYHLGQTLRSVGGWYVFDFEGEPARPLEERVNPSSPFKDVAGMLRSFQYAAATGLFEQIPAERPGLQEKAAAWDKRNREAFAAGYRSVDGIQKYLPENPELSAFLLSAFEVEKALYELEYERAYRPDWTPIPEVALKRLLA